DDLAPAVIDEAAAPRFGPFDDALDGLRFQLQVQDGSRKAFPQIRRCDEEALLRDLRSPQGIVSADGLETSPHDATRNGRFTTVFSWCPVTLCDVLCRQARFVPESGQTVRIYLRPLCANTGRTAG